MYVSLKLWLHEHDMYNNNSYASTLFFSFKPCTMCNASYSSSHSSIKLPCSNLHLDYSHQSDYSCSWFLLIKEEEISHQLYSRTKQSCEALSAIMHDISCSQLSTVTLSKIIGNHTYKSSATAIHSRQKI